MAAKAKTQLAILTCASLAVGGAFLIDRNGSVQSDDTLADAIKTITQPGNEDTGFVGPTLEESWPEAEDENVTARNHWHDLEHRNAESENLSARNHWHDLEYSASEESSQSESSTTQTAGLAFGPGENGMVDLVLSFNDRAEMANLQTQVAELGGEITREYSALPMSAVRVPAFAAAEFAANAGALSTVPDNSVVFLSNSARGTAKLPLTTDAEFVQPDGQNVLAVLDSGVANHGDINLVGRVNVIPPASHKVDASFADSDLQALYLFDEFEGKTVYDRATAGGDVHLTVADEANVVWGSNLLDFDAATRASASNTGGLATACVASDAFTVEAWVTPASASQGGHIVAMGNASATNFALMHELGEL